VQSAGGKRDGGLLKSKVGYKKREKGSQQIPSELCSHGQEKSPIFLWFGLGF